MQGRLERTAWMERPLCRFKSFGAGLISRARWRPACRCIPALAAAGAFECGKRYLMAQVCGGSLLAGLAGAVAVQVQVQCSCSAGAGAVQVQCCPARALHRC